MGQVFAKEPLPLCALSGCHNTCLEDNNGVVHPYCGKTHADQAATEALGAGVGRQHDVCQLATCPELVSFDAGTNRWNDFCSRNHADLAMANWQQSLDGGGGDSDSKCRYPGCVKGVFCDPATGQETGFCSKGHRHLAKGMAGLTVVAPHVDRVFSGGTTSATDFRLYDLSNAHPEYVSLQKQFSSKAGKSTPATVQSVFEVQVPASVYRKTADYKRVTGNVRRRFHGTSCSTMCSFFTDPKGNPCGLKACNVCSICSHGFLQKGSGGLFGKGLYFSSEPDKANAYAGFSQKTSTNGKTLRCMFVANVSAGNAFLTEQRSLPPDMCPPLNYDSVVRNVGTGLGYDELVVYTEEAALPTHLIVYSLP